MKKKILLVVAIVAMLICALAISVNAEYNKNEIFVAADGTELALYDANGNALAWFYDSTTSKYVSYKVNVDFTMALSSGRELLPSTVISDTDGDDSTTFPYTVANMVLLNGRDYSAFTYISGQWRDNNSVLEAMYVNNNFRWINKQTFNGQTKLKVFDIPKDTESNLHFGGSAFANAKSLEYIYIPVNSYFESTSTFEYSALKKAEFHDQWASTMKGYEFFCCYSLEEVVLPSTLTEIAKFSFAFKSVVNDNTTNFRINIPSSVTTIGEKAFQNNTSLVEVNFATTKNLTKIDSPAFENCKRLPKVVLPEGLTTLGNCAFLNCASLTSVTFPSTLTTINGNNHFMGTALTEVIGLENTKLTKMTYQMFRGVKTWKPDVIKLPNTVTVLETFSFADVGVKKVILGSSAVTISNEAFTGCKSMTEFVLPSTLTTINFNNSTARLFFVTSTDTTYLNTVNSKVSGTIISYADYSANPANYASGKYVISGYNVCEAFYDGVHALDPDKSNACAGICANCGEASLAANPVHNYVTTLVYANYLANGTKTMTCQNEGCAHKIAPVVTSVAPVIADFKGFSVNNDGDAITFGYVINYDALDEYVKITGKSVELGFVVAVKAFAGDDAYTSDTSIKASIVNWSNKPEENDNKSRYIASDFILRGDWDKMVDLDGDKVAETDVKKVEFYMAGYLVTNDTVAYLNYGSSGTTADTVTFNDCNAPEIAE